MIKEKCAQISVLYSRKKQKYLITAGICQGRPETQNNKIYTHICICMYRYKNLIWGIGGIGSCDYGNGQVPQWRLKARDPGNLDALFSLQAQEPGELMVSELKGKRRQMFSVNSQAERVFVLLQLHAIQAFNELGVAQPRWGGQSAFTQSTVSNAHPEHRFFPISSLRAGSFKEGEEGILMRVWDSKGERKMGQ